MQTSALLGQGLGGRVGPCNRHTAPVAAPSRSATRAGHRQRRHTVQTRAVASLDGLSSVGGLESLGAKSSSSAPSKQNVADVLLTSEAGMDYTALRDALQQQDFRKADDETREKLIQLAGPNALKRGWVYFTEIKFIPETDLRTIDELWRAASDNKFGYSVQKELWLQSSKYWARFFPKIDWVQGENNNYRKWPAEFDYSLGAARGHLPLTNALRGTQLLQAILEHPAFQKQSGSAASESGKPDWLK